MQKTGFNIVSAFTSFVRGNGWTIAPWVHYAFIAWFCLAAALFAFVCTVLVTALILIRRIIKRYNLSDNQ